MRDTKNWYKICGITTEVDLRAVTERTTASAVGFMAYPKSPRFIQHTKVKELLEVVPCDIRKVGVFVNPTFLEVLDYLNAGINIIQLHGDESAQLAEDCAKFAEVWKALNPRNIDDLKEYENYPADKFLIDAFSTKAKGGTGKLADWDLANSAKQILKKDILLAGGISSKNAQTAIETVNPFGLDLSSSVEKSPGIKNIDLLLELDKVLNL